MTPQLFSSVPVVLVLASLLASGLAVRRLVAGPTNADRIVALDILLAAAIALCLAASLITARTVYLDVALGAALTGFVGTIGWARAVEQGVPKDDGEARE